jgi:hypothetical protein
MSMHVRGVGSETGGVMLVLLGAAGYLLEPLGVVRLITLCVVYLGARDLFAPADGSSPDVFVLALGIWMAVSAYGILGFDFLNSWPLLVVLIGLAFIVQSLIDGSRVASSSAEGP